jgi:SAM-dependent methyltransferase
VIQDPSNRYIAAILSRCDLSGKEVLEIGCGKGRITRDLAKHAKRVVATDPDAEALTIARATILADNVEFIQAPNGLPDLSVGSLDVVIYTLSLHHVPVPEMSSSLNKAARLLNKDGVIVVLEPGDGGSFSMAKEHFGAGSGDERLVRNAVIRAMHALNGWGVEDTIHFCTQFQFDNEDDFLANMLPGYRSQPESFVNEVRTYLHLHRTVNGIILDADRRLNVLRRL